MKLRRRRRVKAFPQKRSQLGGCGHLPENGVRGFAPPSAFGRAAASPQTRQMRCWPSAAQATYHSFPPLPPTKTRSLRCTAFIPPKPLRWVSAGALLGEMIRLPFCIFSTLLCGGGITTLGVCFMPSKRWARRGHGGLISSLSCTRSPSALRAHIAAHRGKHEAFSLPETSTGSIGSTA